MGEAALKRARELVFAWQVRSNLRAEGDTSTEPYEDWIIADIAAALGAWAQEAREKVAAWMIEHSFATGHGNTLDDLLKELSWQVKEQLQQARLEEAKWMSAQIVWHPAVVPPEYCKCFICKRIKELEQRTVTTKGDV